MERIWKQTVTDAMPLGSYLSRVMHFTKRQISQAKFRENGICVNGVQRRITYPLQSGDLVEVKLEEASVCSRQLFSVSAADVPFPLDILWEDADILAVNKSAGMVVHPAHGHYQDTLANQVMAYARGKGENLRIRAVGRLDKETSGIVLFAKNQLTAARLAKQREDGTLTKTYLALAAGRIEPPSGRIDLPIEPEPGSLMKMQTASGQGKPAGTQYRTVFCGDDYTLSEVKIQTGRTHQIRVHFASMGYPLLGDRIYEGPMNRIPRTALHAWRMDFLHPVRKQQISLEAAVPEDMKKLFPEGWSRDFRL